MSKILQIILISLFSLTVISCSKSSDDDSSTASTTSTTDEDTTTTTTTPNTCPAENWWQLMEGSTSRNVSLFAPRTLNRHSEQGSGRVLYVDQAALSQYPKRDNYLSFDVFDADIDWTWEMKGHPHGSYIWPSGGGNDQVDLGANAPVLSDNFTQEAWVYSDNITMDYHYRSIMGSGQGLHAAYSNKWDIDTSPTISIITRNWACTTCGINYGFGTGTKLIKFTADVSVPVKVWHHIATTFDGTNYILYMNGEVVDNNTVTAGDTPVATPVRYLGTDFIGKIDEVRMWSVARTQAEIQANMNNTLADNVTGMVAYYPMAVSDNYSMIIDNSSRANHASITRAEIRSRFFSDNSSCANGPDGTTSCPYPTIRSALDNVTAGDHIYIREGRYSELLTKWQLNHSYERVADNLATEGPKIVIEGYPNEEVILDGTVAINAIWDNYTNSDGHNIYTTVLDMDNISKQINKTVDNITGVFVNGRYMIPAMPMNFKNPTDNTTGNPKNREPGTVWAGIGKSPFNTVSDIDPGEDEDEEEEDDTTTVYGSDGSAYVNDYVPGDLANLDNNEEWSFDSATKTLYLYPSDNNTTPSSNVRVRVRDRFLYFAYSDNIEFKNIHFFAGSVRFFESSYLTIEDSKFSFSGEMGLNGNNVTFGSHTLVRNTIFEYINDSAIWSQNRTMFPTMENVLFRYNDWFKGSYLYGSTNRNYRGARGDGTFKVGGSVWRYVTIENSSTAGIYPAINSLVEYARFENLYDAGDGGGIQRNPISVPISTTRYSWFINIPGFNGMRFDGSCSGNNGDVHHVVSAGNRRGFRLKGDYHDVYHVNAYDNARKDVSMSAQKYCGLDMAGDTEPGNSNSNFYNSIVETSLVCNTPSCSEAVAPYGGVSNFSPLAKYGIWLGHALGADPHFELADPWIQNRARSNDNLTATFGQNPWNVANQDYDFRPRKGSYLIDNGLVIPGINDGADTNPEHKQECKFISHPPLYSGQ
ncbi:MAG: LamG domain-containing protein, partial [Candidatus Poseidoniia archaeon]|nr:LamG domain-containing protein [Candidatus Poseidoniia archaeon]